MGIGTYVRTSKKPTTVPVSRVKTGSGDMVLVAIVFALCIFGLLMVFSASTDITFQTTVVETGLASSPYYIFFKQVILMILGMAMAVGVSRLDYHLFRKVAVPMLIGALLSLIGVLIFGGEILGSKRTFIGGSIQPSEFAKLVIIIYLAVWLYSKRDYLHKIMLGLFPMGIILGVVTGLILREPDISAAATILVLGGLLFFLADGDIKQILILLVAAGLVGWLVVTTSDTARNRLAEYITGLKDPLKSGDHILFSLESIANGGFLGVGIGNASIKFEGLPLSATDSIFAVIIEELGFVGAFGLILLYGLLVWRGLKIAEHAPDMLGKLLAGGLSIWIGLEALMNMAVMVGLLPFAGNALPFISVGGSSLFCVLAAIGILMGISRQCGKVTQKPVMAQRRSYGATADLRRGNRRRSLPRTHRS